MKKIKNYLPEIIGIGATLLTIAFLGLLLYWLVTNNYPKALLEFAWSIPEKTGYVIAAVVTGFAVAAWALIVFDVIRTKKTSEE